MTSKKTTRRALVMSLLSLLLCMSMLVGTTFAWFTDSVTSGRNQIVAGNLDVALYWSTNATDWEAVDADTNVFTENLWEPGHTEVVYLKIVNEGTLALKYQFGVNVASETTGKNAAGEPFKLSNYICYDIIDTDTAFADRDAARAAVTDEKVIAAGYSQADALESEEEECVAMVVYMPEEVGNEANYMTGTAVPTINLGIELFATQLSYESDSFGDDYDIDAMPADVIATPENINDVLAAAQPGDVIGLADGAYYDMSIVIPCDDITLVSNTAIADHVNVNGMDNVKLIGITFDAYAPHNVVDPKGTSTIRANITTTDGAKGPENLQILNCKFVDLYGVSSADASTDPYCPIAISDINRVTGATNNIVIDSCTFDTNAAYYIYMYYPGDPNIKPMGDIIIRNNTFGNGNTTVGDAVYIGGAKSNVSVLENTFTNGAVVVAPHNNASCTYALKVSVVGNHFINTSDATVYAIGLRHFHSLPKCNTVVKDNIANYGASEISAPYIDSQSYERYDINGGELVFVSIDDKNNGALAAPNKVYVLGSGDYGKLTAIGKGSTIIGNGETVFATHESAVTGTLDDVTIKNVTISGSNAQRWCYAKGNVVFENCVIDAKGVYAVHYDGLTGADVLYKDCVITGWSAIGGGANSLVFDGCEIYGNGAYGVIRSYSNATIKNCYFDVSKVNATDVYPDGIEAVDCTITIENCTTANGAIADICNTVGVGAIEIK